MLSGKNRITGKKDIEKVFKKGKSFKEEFLLLKVAPNSLPISRFTFIVSQKVAKKATGRNRIKRRLRELVKSQINNIKKGFDGIFVALPGLEKKSYPELGSIIITVFKKAKLI